MQSNKVVLITGSSRGIGAATALLFAKNKFDVCINYQSNEKAANTVAKQIRALGVNCLCVKADVSKEPEVEALFSVINKEFGRLDALVNNAAIMQPQIRLEEMTADRINKVLNTNVTSCFICCREAIKLMSPKNKGQGGTIVNVSSAASRTGSPNEYIDYAASKGAIDTLTLGLSKELAGENIRVNGVRPGLIYTDLHADGGEPDRVNRLKALLPMKRGGQPEEVAEAIYWLSTEKSSYSTGCIIDTSGGL